MSKATVDASELSLLGPSLSSMAKYDGMQKEDRELKVSYYRYVSQAKKRMTYGAAISDKKKKENDIYVYCIFR